MVASSRRRFTDAVTFGSKMPEAAPIPKPDRWWLGDATSRSRALRSASSMACARVSSMRSPSGRGWDFLCPLDRNDHSGSRVAARATPLQNGEGRGARPRPRGAGSGAPDRRCSRCPPCEVYPRQSVTKIRRKFAPKGGSGSWQRNLRTASPRSIRSSGWRSGTLRPRADDGGRRAARRRARAERPALLPPPAQRCVRISPLLEPGPRGEERAVWGSLGAPGRPGSAPPRRSGRGHDHGPVGQVSRDAEIVPEEKVSGPPGSSPGARGEG